MGRYDTIDHRSANPMPNVLCAGHINWDVTIRVDTLPKPDGEARIRSQYQSGGGSAANVATALTALDIQTAVLGSVGDDDYGTETLGTLQEAGVDTELVTVVPEQPTTVKYLIVESTNDGQVMVFGNDGANEAITPTDITEETVQPFDHVHLTGQRPATARTLADYATRTGATVSVDPGRRLADRDYESVLDHADIVFLNGRELECLPTRIDDEPIESIESVDDVTIVCTDGKRGATAYTADRSHHHGGFTVDTIDTAGAGDAFAAGFLTVALCQTNEVGIDYERALTVANACGALATTVEGAQLRFDRREIDQFLDRHSVPERFRYERK